MNQEVTDFIEALKEPWHKEFSVCLREVVSYKCAAGKVAIDGNW